MAKIRLTEAQFKNYMRHILNEQRNVDYAKAVLNEELEKLSKPNNKK